MGDARSARRRRSRPARLPDVGRRARRHRRLRRLLRDARVRGPVAAGQERGAVGPVRRRHPGPRQRRAARALAARRHGPEPPRLLRDDRDRPRVGRAVGAHHGDLRRRQGRVRRRHPHRVGAQGLHRQRRPRRAHGRGVRAAVDRARGAGAGAPRRPRGPRPAARRGRHRPARRRDHRRRPQGGPQRRRQRAPGLPRGARPAREPPRPLRHRRRRRHLLELDREREPALLHHARRPGARPGQRLGLGGRGRDARADDRDPLRRGASPVRRARRRRRDHDPRLPRPPAEAAAAAGPDVRAALRPERARRDAARHPDHAGGRRRRRRAPAARARVARGRDQGAVDVERHRGHPDLAARPAAGRATSRRTGSRTCAPTPTCSRRSRATTPSCSSWSPRA